jgi:hypothetical protein
MTYKAPLAEQQFVLDTVAEIRSLALANQGSKDLPRGDQFQSEDAPRDN